MFKVWSAQSSGNSRRLRDGCKLRLIARIRIFGTSTPQFHTDPLSSTHRFHTRTTPFQLPKSLSSTPKSPQFNTESLSSTPKIHQFHLYLSSTPKSPSSTPKTPSSTHTSVILGSRFLVWIWGILGAEKVWFLSGTDVWN